PTGLKVEGCSNCHCQANGDCQQFLEWLLPCGDETGRCWPMSIMGIRPFSGRRKLAMQLFLQCNGRNILAGGLAALALVASAMPVWAQGAGTRSSGGGSSVTGTAGGSNFGGLLRRCALGGGVSLWGGG